MLVLLAASLAAACEAVPPAGGSSGAPSPEEGVFFPRQEPGLVGFDSLGIGRLVIDEAGCLRLRDESGNDTVPLWPPGYGLDDGGGRERVLDARGRTAGRVDGGEVTMGGGGVTVKMVRDGLVDGRTERELLERCPGDYFLVAGHP